MTIRPFEEGIDIQMDVEIVLAVKRKLNLTLLTTLNFKLLKIVCWLLLLVKLINQKIYSSLPELLSFARDSFSSTMGAFQTIDTFS